MTNTMCAECNQYPCNVRCPNASEQKVFAKCDNCDCDILNNDDYYDIYGAIICVDCILYLKKIAEME